MAKMGVWIDTFSFDNYKKIVFKAVGFMKFVGEKV